MALLSGQLGTGRFRNERRVFKFPGAHTWTIPTGVTQVFAFVIGGGGGGDGASYYINSGGAGGGYAHGIISGLTPGNTITCTVGQGGTGGSDATGQSSSDGTASSFGSYLTGGGGEKAQKSITNNSSTSSDGGAGSTSGVSEAFTATGGKGGINGAGGNNSPGAFGGGGSGSPFGTPGTMKCTSSTSSSKPFCTGGMGWHGSTKTFQIPQRSNGPGMSLGACGMGSHGQVSYVSPFYDGYAMYNYEGPQGGPGMRGAKGGKGGINAGDSVYYQYRNSNQTQASVMKQYQSNSVNSGTQPGAQAESGESLDWWFPWEMDGGGGGGVSGGISNNNSYRSYNIHAGHGGNGSGGGPMSYQGRSSSGNWNTNTFEWSGTAGNGGFGGGGGGAMSNVSQGYFHPEAGHGGVGGGGGSCASQNNSIRWSAGYGGDGIVVIYW